MLAGVDPVTGSRLIEDRNPESGLAQAFSHQRAAYPGANNRDIGFDIIREQVNLDTGGRSTEPNRSAAP